MKPAIKFKILILVSIYLLMIPAYALSGEKITIQLNWTHQFEFAGFYAAVEKGYYKNKGLDVVLKERKKGLIPVKEVIEGRADYGIWVSNLILDRMKGKPVVIVANYFKNSPLVIISNSNIRIPSQLKGKKVMGIPEDSNIAEIAYMLKQNGINQNELTWVPHSYNPFDVTSGKVDAMTAYITNQPYLLHRTRESFNILDPSNYGANFYGDSLFTSQKEVDDNRDRVKKIIKATNLGWKYAVKNPGEIIDIIIKKYSVKKSRKALLYEAEKTIEIIQPNIHEIGSIDPERIKRIAEIFYDMNFIKNYNNLNGFIFDKDIKIDNKIPIIKLSDKEKAFIKNNPIIKVTNEFDWPPFDFTVAGEAKGFGIDLLNMIFKRVGLTPKYINGYTWDELIAMFYNGKIDVTHSLSITPERAKKTLFSLPYYHSKNVFIQRYNQKEIKKLEELNGKIVALPKGWSTIEFLKANYPKIHILTVENIREALDYVDQGMAYATIEQKEIAEYLINKFGFTDLKVSKRIKNKELQKTSSMHFAVLKKNQILMDILNKGLETITAQEMANLKKKWFSYESYNIGIKDAGLTPSEKQYLNSLGEIRFSCDPNRLPLEGIENNRITGMTSDFTRILSGKIGAKLKLVPTSSWKESLFFLRNKKTDIIPMINKTPERKEFISFTPPYLKFGFGIIVRDSFPFISSIDYFEGKKLALVEGSHIYESIKTRYPKILIVPCINQQQAILKVSQSKADAAISLFPVADQIIKHLGLGNLKVAGTYDQLDELRIGVNKDNIKLLNIMNKAVRSLSKKEIEEIQSKWVSLSYESKIDYSLFIKAGIVVSIIMAVIILWNRKLMYLNQKIIQANIEIKQKSKELELISITDSLTGLYNRRYLESNLHKETERVKRYLRELSLMIIDIDNFKEVNDTFGHQTGDMVLIEISQLLKTSIRKTDISGRWGGEEFMVICPETDIHGAAQMAEQLRIKFASNKLDKIGHKTISIGISSLKPENNEEILIKNADKALYNAKFKGKNRIEIYRG